MSALPTPTHAEAATVVRIEHIAELMRTLRFVRGKTVKRLAAEWGLTEQRVRELSAEASRMVKAEITDPDRVTVTACGYVEWALREAKKAKDTRAIAPLAKAWAELAGTLAPRKVEITGGGVVAAADPEQQAAIYEAAARALRSGKEGA